MFLLIVLRAHCLRYNQNPNN